MGGRGVLWGVGGGRLKCSQLPRRSFYNPFREIAIPRIGNSFFALNQFKYRTSLNLDDVGDGGSLHNSIWSDKEKTI